MLLWMSSHRCDGCVVGQDGLVEGAGEVAFQAADDLLFGHALLGAPVHVRTGGRVPPQPGQDDPVEGRVRASVAAAGQPEPAVGLPRGCGDRGDPAQGSERGFGGQPVGVVAGGDEEFRGAVRADPVGGPQGGRGLVGEDVQVPVRVVTFGLQPLGSAGQGP